MDSTASSLSVFLTNATNAVGRELTRQFVARGHRVTGVTSGSEGAGQVRADGGIPAFGDILRAGELKSAMTFAKPDVVIHSAAVNGNHLPFTASDWDAQAKILSEGTKALVEAARAVGVKFLIYPSTTLIYGDTHGEWVDETAPRLNASQLPEGAIFRAMLQGEDAALKSDLPAAVVRAGYIYSAEDPAALALFNAVKNTRPVITGDGHAYANWIHAADLARALVLIAEQQPAGQIFNITDGTPATPAQFANYFADGLGLPHPSQPPAFVQSLTGNKMQRALLGISNKVRSDKAREQLGWAPRYNSYQAGIDQMLLQWRAQEPA
jgi:2-alkyl-3-oxoalkanoate reductase